MCERGDEHELDRPVLTYDDLANLRLGTLAHPRKPLVTLLHEQRHRLSFRGFVFFRS